jgi:catechol 2,3-dioxygenase-like lactoylglutathione lyase family enzyme
VSIIKIADISHVRFTAPDLQQMEEFLVQFGLTPTLWPDDVLYARGAGAAPFLHATALGEAGFTALGLRAESIADLVALALAEGAAVEDLDAPGGGKVVRVRDPDGHLVEVVAGQTPADPLPIEPESQRNSAMGRPRVRKSVRLRPGPATVIRLGHCVLEVSDFRRAEAWYKSRFGFITSDEIEAAPGAAVGAFLRCDRGDTPTDHHTLFLLQSPRGPGFQHAAFEVSGLDDLMRGHAHLKKADRQAAWGIGRHVLGSQIFDYWKDPWGHEVEHWTDGDLLVAADGSNTKTLHDVLNVQWGPAHPMLAGFEGGQS